MLDAGVGVDSADLSAASGWGRCNSSLMSDKGDPQSSDWASLRFFLGAPETWRLSRRRKSSVKTQESRSSPSVSRSPGGSEALANPRIGNAGSQGFDLVRFFVLRGGIPGSMGDFPEI